MKFVWSLKVIKIQLYNFLVYNFVRRYIHVVKMVWQPMGIVTFCTPLYRWRCQNASRLISKPRPHEPFSGFIRNFHPAISVQYTQSSLPGKGYKVIVVSSILFIVSQKIRRLCSVSNNKNAFKFDLLFYTLK